MPDRMKISDDIIIGAQPSEAELKAMAEEGIRTVLNLRTSDEDMQPLKPDDEGQVADGFGLTYESFPVSMENTGPELVDDFREVLQRVDKPVFIHCKLGKRAGAMVMMDMAVRENWTGDQTIQKAEDMGFECDNEQLESFLRQYVDEHRSGNGGNQ